MRTFTLRSARTGTERLYVGVEFPNGGCVICDTERPPHGPWNNPWFPSIEGLERALNASVTFDDEPKASTTSTKPAPSPCPLPDGDCTTPPDVITGG